MNCITLDFIQQLLPRQQLAAYRDKLANGIWRGRVGGWAQARWPSNRTDDRAEQVDGVAVPAEFVTVLDYGAIGAAEKRRARLADKRQ